MAAKVWNVWSNYVHIYKDEPHGSQKMEIHYYLTMFSLTANMQNVDKYENLAK